MLRQRVITAVILLAVVILTLFLAPAWAWGCLAAGGLWLAGREWQRLILPAATLLHAAAASGGAGPATVGAQATAGAGASAGSPAGGSSPWLATGLLIAALAALWWRETAAAEGPAAWQSALIVVDMLLWLLIAVPAVFRGRPFPFGARTFAAVSLFSLWLGLYELRRIDPVLVLTVMAVIFVADIGAYFFGRALGRHKLAPRVSPGKSWEGAIGGLVAVLVVSLAVAVLMPGESFATVFPRWLADRAGLAVMAAVLVAMVALSVIGDLHESLLKRACGVKDSGRLFPGHGGVLDRIDALVPTVPLALLVIQGIGASDAG